MFLTLALILAGVAAMEAVVIAREPRTQAVPVADAPKSVIGEVPTVTRPALDLSASQPPGTVSHGTAETGPHGQVDITKPMPAAPPTLPQAEPDKPVKP